MRVVAAVKAFKRAADGGIAAAQTPTNGLMRANRGEFSVRGDVIRVKEKAYVSMPISGGFIRNLGGTAGIICPVPYSGAGFFIFSLNSNHIIQIRSDHHENDRNTI